MQSSSHQPDVGVLGTPDESALKLLVQGFTLPELQLLDTIVQLSRRRQPRIELLHDGENADVVMIDAADSQARKWAANQRWLAHKAVIWVDAPGEAGPTLLHRPVLWSALPVLLARALEKTPSTAACAAAKPESNAVLVVDDSAAVRAQLRALLESRGLAVADVDSAEAALAAAAESHYACILMDVLMPGIDGYEACRRVKANTHDGAAPTVVMLTSKSSPFDRIRGKMAGCDAYLTKPVDPEHLYEVISRYTATPATAAPHGMAPPQFA